MIKGKKIFSIFIIVFLLVLIFYISSLLFWRINLEKNSNLRQTLVEQSLQNKVLQTGQQMAGVLKTVIDFPFSEKDLPDQLNILILGIPGQNHPGSNLTDSIVIASLKPKNKSLTVISLPRDLLVQIPNRNTFTKINSLYYLSSADGVKQKVEQITGLKPDYYIIINLETVEEIIELIDGINIYVPQDIIDPFFPGPNSGYQTFSIKAGWRYLDGKTALMYMRTRYTSPHGDFDRMDRQQQVLRAIKQKVFSLNPLWDFGTYLKIYDSLQSKIKTDLTLYEIKYFWQIAQQLDINKILTATIDNDDTNLVYGSMTKLGQTDASVVLPKAGQENYLQIRDYIAQLLARQ